jgi:hypothetical protein
MWRKVNRERGSVVSRTRLTSDVFQSAWIDVQFREPQRWFYQNIFTLSAAHNFEHSKFPKNICIKHLWDFFFLSSSLHSCTWHSIAPHCERAEDLFRARNDAETSTGDRGERSFQVSNRSVNSAFFIVNLHFSH